MNPFFYLIVFSLAIILYNYDAFFIEYLFFIPLFIFIIQISHLNYKRILGIFFIISVGIIISTYWVFSTKQASFFTIYLANAGFYFTFMLFIYILKRLDIKYYLLYTPSIYFILMGILSLFPYGNFWINISQTGTYLTPVTYYIGTIGFSGVLLLFQASLTKILFDRKNRISSCIFIITLIILIIPIFSSLIIDEDNEKNKSLTIAGIQGNLEFTYNERLNKKGFVFDYYLNKSRAALKNNSDIDLIVWPEYTLPKNISFHQLKKLRGLIGNSTIHFAIGSEKIGNDSSSNYNSFYIVNKSTIQYYNAYHPINLQTDVKDIATTNEKIVINNVSVGFLLCYDEMYPDSYVKQIRNNEAELFVLGGNLGFLENNRRGLELIALNGKTRTSETKRELVRVESNGLTSYFNTNGKMVDNIEPFKDGILIKEVKSNDGMTFYVTYFYSIQFIYYIMSFIIVIIVLLMQIFYNKKIFKHKLFFKHEK